MGKKIVGMLLVMGMVLFVTGCEEEAQKRGQNYDYTVLAEKDIPKEVMTQVKEEGKDAFQFSYQDGEYLYIAVGYGEKETGGYSIIVDGLYELGDNICFETTLHGPLDKEGEEKSLTYPRIVIKMEKMEKRIIYK